MSNHNDNLNYIQMKLEDLEEENSLETYFSSCFFQLQNSPERSGFRVRVEVDNLGENVGKVADELFMISEIQSE